MCTKKPYYTYALFIYLQVLSVVDTDDFLVKYLRKKGIYFHFPPVEDIHPCAKKDCRLVNVTKQRRGCYSVTE